MPASASDQLTDDGPGICRVVVTFNCVVISVGNVKRVVQINVLRQCRRIDCLVV